jgi:hypothetical protein
MSVYRSSALNSKSPTKVFLVFSFVQRALTKSPRPFLRVSVHLSDHRLLGTVDPHRQNGFSLYSISLIPSGKKSESPDTSAV